MAAGQDESEQVPLAFPQHLLRFLEVLHPGSAFGPSFVINAAYRIAGRVDEGALRAAYDAVVERHDALRAVVQRDGGVPWQRIAPSTPASAERVRVVDLSPVAEKDRDERIGTFLDDADTRPCPADEAPLLWLLLGRLADDDAVLVVTAHHSVADAWSMNVVMRDLADGYRAHLAGARAKDSLRPPPMSYAEYARADQGSPTVTPESVEYWKRALDGVPVASLPMLPERPTGPGVGKARLRYAVSPEVTARVTEVARRARCSPFITLLTAYLVVLHRLGGTTDIAVPTLTSGRGRPELDDTVGFFVNALLLRTSLAGDPTVGELLERARRTCLDAYRFEIPVLRLIEDVPDAGLLLADERFGLLPFQHIPMPQNSEWTPLGGGSDYRPIRKRNARQDRGVAVPLDGLWTAQHETAGGLSGTVTYSGSLFAPETMQAAVDGFTAVLGQYADAFDRPISSLRLAD